MFNKRPFMIFKGYLIGWTVNCLLITCHLQSRFCVLVPHSYFSSNKCRSAHTLLICQIIVVRRCIPAKRMKYCYFAVFSNHTNKITREHFCPQHRCVIQHSSDYEPIIKHSRPTSTFIYNFIILVCFV